MGYDPLLSCMERPAFILIVASAEDAAQTVADMRIAAATVKDFSAISSISSNVIALI